MKRFLIISTVFLLFFGSVWAQSVTLPIMCDDPSQIMFKLTDLSNAHASDASTDNNYAVEVCYDDFFEATYTGSTPEVCSDGNLLFNLSDTSNAHADFAGETFDVPLCYGDLKECVLVSSQDECYNFASQIDSNYRGATIATFEGESVNAHLGYGNQPTGGADLILCCLGNPLCNNDGVCDPEENYFNCYEDCVNEPPCIPGNGLDYFEECDCGLDGICDGTESGGATCSSASDGSLSGNGLRCDLNTCIYITNSCDIGGGGGTDVNWCADRDSDGDFIYSSSSCSGGSCEVTTCEQVNQLSLNAADKERACNSCGNNANFDWAGPNQRCEWDAAAASCNTIDVLADGTQCKQVILNEGECLPGATTKQVTVRYEKIGGPGTCDPGTPTITVPCARTVRLPFFGLANGFIAVILIGLCYLYVKRK